VNEGMARLLRKKACTFAWARFYIEFEVAMARLSERQGIVRIDKKISQIFIY
jgi:hypothetical protein